jgi:predicted phage tail component-like protein
MNYIILNDKKSTEIVGLMICNLPPISKPAKKVYIEEIDGVDGDIITELGYMPYDKEFQIGLTYNYDIDEVIEYFNSEGKVVFSNEPERYYRYKIIEQIDFEKLLRYKTATVKMHIQPFKFCNELCEKTFEITTQKEVEVNNGGNVFSKPTITLFGTGIINLSLNGNETFIIDLSNEEQITIDTERMEAYNQETQILKNRLITGNYDNFYLQRGRDTIGFTGTVTKIIIDKFSRWI